MSQQSRRHVALDIAYEAQWLHENPHFSERPATIAEFLGVGYLDIESEVRPAIRDALVDMFGQEVSGDRIARLPLAIITGAIGIGKTTIASIILAYMVHWVSCLRNPQKYFNLLPGSRIAFMQMSTSRAQAQAVVFGDIKARILNSDWFKRHCPFDPSFKNQLHFPKDIWIVPGDSGETTFEGFNILGGIIDEADSHQVTQHKDYAEEGYDTIRNRIDSRFGDRGFLIVIGQMKRSDGFAKRTYDSFVKRDDAYALHLTIWESFGLDHPQYQCTEVGPHKLAPDLEAGQTCGALHTFPFDMRRKEVITDELAAVLGTEATDVIRIPMLYFREFETNPEKSLRDLAGVPPLVGDPFIGRPYKIEEARDRWIANLQTGPESPIGVDGVLADWFKVDDSIPRVGHIDIAYSGDGDAYGFAMGHIEGVVDIDGELKPYIVIDLLRRVKAPSGGGEIDLGEVRHFIYDLRDGRSDVKLKKVTYDGFESTDTRQQLRKKRFEVDYLSVDKTLLPYYDLRDALYEDRIEIPPYFVHITPGSTDLVEIAVKELSELIDNGKKVDHPVKGCFVGETRVPLLDGTTRTMSELVDRDVWVYSARPDGTIVPGRARGRYTHSVTHLVDVVLDSGAVVRCTPEHPFMLRDGTYREARALRPGVDRLMPITRLWPVNGGYESVTDCHGTRTLTHRLVEEHVNGHLPGNLLVHHHNEVKTDNRPENLHRTTQSAHASEHTRARWRDDADYRQSIAAGLRRFNESDRGRRLHSEAVTAMTASRDSDSWRSAAEKHPRFRRDVTKDQLLAIRDDPGALTAHGAARLLDCGRNVIVRVLKDHGFATWDEFRGANHKVREIIRIDVPTPIPVFDLEVDEWSNFALAGGVFVHNSKDVADCIAGVVSTLMGNRAYRRNTVSLADHRERRHQATGTESYMRHPAYRGAPDVRAPLPPPDWRSGRGR